MTNSHLLTYKWQSISTLASIFILLSVSSCRQSYPDPIPVVRFTTGEITCVAPCEVFFFNETANQSRFSYSWDFGDGTIVSNSTGVDTTYTFRKAGTYIVTLKAENSQGQIHQFRDTLAIQDSLLAFFTVLDDSCEAPCDPLFRNESINTDTYEWDFGDGNSSTDESPRHVYLEPGTYSVKLKASSSTSTRVVEPYEREVVILDTIVAAFSVLNNSCAAPCDPVFRNESKNADTFVWDFGDGNSSTAENPNHVYNVPGTYSVVLTVSNSVTKQSATINRSVTVLPSFLVNASLRLENMTNNRYAPATVSLVSTTPDSLNSFTYTWEMGDPANTRLTGTSVTHTYTDSGSFRIQLIVEAPNGNKDTAFQDVRIERSVSFDQPRYFGGSNNATCWSLVQTFDLGFEVIGYTNESNGDHYLYLAHIDPYGRFVAARIYDTLGDVEGLDILQTPDSGFVIVGRKQVFSGEYRNWLYAWIRIEMLYQEPSIPTEGVILCFDPESINIPPVKGWNLLSLQLLIEMEEMISKPISSG